MDNPRRTALTVILNTFFFCVVAYFIEYRFFYSRVVPLFGSAIISKILGIIAVIVALKILKSNFKSIGYVAKAKKIISGIIAPVVILAVCAAIAYAFIWLLVTSQGGTLTIGYDVGHTNSTLSPYVSFVMVTISTIITAFMAETLLRGLVLQTANNHLKFYAANTMAVILSIIWHNVIYVFGIAYGTMTSTEFIRSTICATVIYGAAAIRRGLYTRAWGSIWACLVDYIVSVMVIGSLPLTITLPYDFVPTNPVGYLVSFMSSKLNNSYASIAFMGMVSVLSLIVMIIYCRILKKRARKKYIKRISESNAEKSV